VKIEVVVEIAYYLTIQRSDRIRAGGQIYFVFKPAGPHDLEWKKPTFNQARWIHLAWSAM